VCICSGCPPPLHHLFIHTQVYMLASYPRHRRGLQRALFRHHRVRSFVLCSLFCALCSVLSFLFSLLSALCSPLPALCSALSLFKHINNPFILSSVMSLLYVSRSAACGTTTPYCVGTSKSLLTRSKGRVASALSARHAP
jgi:hypothetical protein